MMSGLYNIKKEYCTQQKDKFQPFSDIELEDEFQNPVYYAAKRAFINQQLDTVLDIGCGSAFKLIKHFGACSTIGLDVLDTVAWLKRRYPERIWGTLELLPEILGCDLVLCSDVIEHVWNPDIILNILNAIEFKLCVISTPDRDRVHGTDHNGPPVNVSHVREWNYTEFRKYISRYFDIKEHYYPAERYSNAANNYFDIATQMVLISRRRRWQNLTKC